jgi:thiol-disulfide isomerase/thioredoxin
MLQGFHLDRPARPWVLLRVLLNLVWLGGLVCGSGAYAQFEKTPWPAAAPSLSETFKDHTGQSISSESLKGKKLVINFWATWCAPCKEELPTLQIFSDLQDPTHTRVLTINVKEPASRALRFMQNNQITLPLVPDPQGEWAKKFDVKVFPTTLLVAPSGQIRWRIVGEVDWSSKSPQMWLDSLR